MSSNHCGRIGSNLPQRAWKGVDRVYKRNYCLRIFSKPDALEGEYDVPWELPQSLRLPVHMQRRLVGWVAPAIALPGGQELQSQEVFRSSEYQPKPPPTRPVRPATRSSVEAAARLSALGSTPKHVVVDLRDRPATHAKFTSRGPNPQHLLRPARSQGEAAAPSRGRVPKTPPSEPPASARSVPRGTVGRWLSSANVPSRSRSRSRRPS